MLSEYAPLYGRRRSDDAWRAEMDFAQVIYGESEQLIQETAAYYAVVDLLRRQSV